MKTFTDETNLIIASEITPMWRKLSLDDKVKIAEAMLNLWNLSHNETDGATMTVPWKSQKIRSYLPSSTSPPPFISTVLGMITFKKIQGLRVIVGIELPFNYETVCAV